MTFLPEEPGFRQMPIFLRICAHNFFRHRTRHSAFYSAFLKLVHIFCTTSWKFVQLYNNCTRQIAELNKHTVVIPHSFYQKRQWFYNKMNVKTMVVSIIPIRGICETFKKDCLLLPASVERQSLNGCGHFYWERDDQIILERVG